MEMALRSKKAYEDRAYKLETLSCSPDDQTWNGSNLRLHSKPSGKGRAGYNLLSQAKDYLIKPWTRAWTLIETEQALHEETSISLRETPPNGIMDQQWLLIEKDKKLWLDYHQLDQILFLKEGGNQTSCLTQMALLK
ncbi:hypothetical protein Tco_0303800 [Tanacetum coccineum]